MKTSFVTVVKGEKWASLSLSLGEEMNAGKCAKIKGEFVIDIARNEGPFDANEAEMWKIAILSGAPYAFRLMNTTHKELVVHYLRGRLNEEDITGVSIASSIAIVDIMGGDVGSVSTGEWHQVIL